MKDFLARFTQLTGAVVGLSGVFAAAGANVLTGAATLVGGPTLAMTFGAAAFTAGTIMRDDPIAEQKLI